MKAIITIELDYPEQIYDLYETKEIRFYDKEGVYMLWEGGFEIKPMPQRKIVGKIEKVDDFMKSEIQIINEKVTARMMLDTELLLASGYNKCIDEILGE